MRSFSKTSRENLVDSRSSSFRAVFLCGKWPFHTSIKLCISIISLSFVFALTASKVSHKIIRAWQYEISHTFIDLYSAAPAIPFKILEVTRGGDTSIVSYFCVFTVSYPHIASWSKRTEYNCNMTRNKSRQNEKTTSIGKKMRRERTAKHKRTYSSSGCRSNTNNSARRWKNKMHLTMTVQ